MFLAVLAVALFALVGLVIDGGRAVAAQSAASGDAEQAARTSVLTRSRYKRSAPGSSPSIPWLRQGQLTTICMRSGAQGKSRSRGNGVRANRDLRANGDIGMIGLGQIGSRHPPVQPMCMA